MNGIALRYWQGHLMSECEAHVWGPTHDNERVVCVKCECSPSSAEADEPCCVVYLVEHKGTLEEFHTEMARLRVEVPDETSRQEKA